MDAWELKGARLAKARLRPNGGVHNPHNFSMTSWPTKTIYSNLTLPPKIDYGYLSGSSRCPNFIARFFSIVTGFVHGEQENKHIKTTMHDTMIPMEQPHGYISPALNYHVFFWGDSCTIVGHCFQEVQSQVPRDLVTAIFIYIPGGKTPSSLQVA